MLVVYDRSRIAPEMIVKTFAEEKRRIGEYFGKKVHCTYLNTEEERETSFMSMNDCQAIGDAVPSYVRSSGTDRSFSD